MRYVQGTELNVERETAVTLGKFDGMHRGHQDLLREMMTLQNDSLMAVVFTFGTSPYALLNGAKKFLLMTNQEKEAYCERLGADLLVEYPFTDEICKMSPETFIKEVLVDGLKARYIIVGADFGFGYKRQGNVKLLKELEAKYGYQTIVLEKRLDETGREISSTYVREELQNGNMEKVTSLLGEPYEVMGTIVHGKQLGRTFGLPTINLEPEADKLLPPNGVYVSRVHVGGKCYGGATNIGMKPTVSDHKQVNVETFILDFEGDIYGETVRVELLHYIRPEQKFPDLKALETQIRKDSETSKAYLLNNH